MGIIQAYYPAPAKEVKERNVSVEFNHPRSYVDYDNLAPVETTEDVVRCDGGERGHSWEYIKTDYNSVTNCKYCQQRFQKVHRKHHH